MVGSIDVDDINDRVGRDQEDLRRNGGSAGGACTSRIDLRLTLRLQQRASNGSGSRSFS